MVTVVTVTVTVLLSEMTADGKVEGEETNAPCHRSTTRSPSFPWGRGGGCKGRRRRQGEKRVHVAVRTDEGNCLWHGHAHQTVQPADEAGAPGACHEGVGEEEAAAEIEENQVEQHGERERRRWKGRGGGKEGSSIRVPVPKQGARSECGSSATRTLSFPRLVLPHPARWKTARIGTMFKLSFRRHGRGE